MNRTVAIDPFCLRNHACSSRQHVAADEQPLFGYSVESSRIERQWEEKLVLSPPETSRLYAKTSAYPHHVGFKGRQGQCRLDRLKV